MPRVPLKKIDTLGSYFGARERQNMFAREFVLDFSGSQAVKRVGYKGLNVHQAAYDLLKLPYVQERITKLLNERAERLQVASDDIARLWFTLATADARELCPVVLACCRYCNGIDHQYQYTTNEIRIARVRHLVAQMRKKEKDRVPFDEKGGDGYDYRNAPDAACPECNGAGVAHVIPIDVNKLSNGAALLFDGYKVHKDGTIEIKVRDRSRALENLTELLGLNRKRAILHVNPDDMDDNELDAVLEAYIQRGGVITQKQIEKVTRVEEHQD